MQDDPSTHAAGEPPSGLLGGAPRDAASRPQGVVARVASWPPVVLGLLGVGITAVVYPLVAPGSGSPLGVFVLAPLAVAALGTHRETRIVALAALIVATVEGRAGGLDGASLAARLVVVAIGGVLAVLGATLRVRREAQVRELEVHRAVTAAFQESLVPVPAPPPGVLATARYRPAQAPLRIGGDFVDVVTLSDGTAGFIIGDVCGHGPGAAAFGTRIRAAWKGIAYTIPRDPSRWLEGLDRAFFDDGRYDGFVTAHAGRLSASGEVQIAGAGHPLPLRRGALGVEEVPVPPALPLGIDSRTRRTVTCFALGPQESLFLYTDGLIENSRSPDGRAGEQGLVRVLAELDAPGSLDDVLGIFGPTGFDDDVALLELSLAEYSPPDPPGRTLGTDPLGGRT